MQGHQHHNKALLVSKCQRLWWITFRRLSSAIELSWPISLILFGQNKEILLAIAHIHYILGIVCITKVSKESNLIPDMVIPFGPFWIPLDPFWIPLDPFGSPSPIQFHIFTLSNSTFNPLQWCLNVQAFWGWTCLKAGLVSGSELSQSSRSGNILWPEVSKNFII